MTWVLNKSRGLYFRRTGDHPHKSAWTEEAQLLRSAGFLIAEGDDLGRWDPSAPGVNANCPSLDRTLRELKGLVGPIWRARVANIYAGRTDSKEETALSAHARKGGIVVISFRYTYALLASTITWGDFLQFVDEAKIDSDVLGKATDIKRGLIAAFELLGDRGAAAIGESNLMHVPSKEHARAAASYQAVAEMWVLAHELAHHILRDGTSRPDIEAQGLVDSVLMAGDLQAELRGMSESQLGEIRADVLALLLVAGEFSGDKNPITELQSALGALFALLAVGLLRGDWLAQHGDEHPSTVTRLAVIAKLATRRIMSVDVLPEDMREEQVRAMATVLTYATWVSGVPVSADLGESPDHLHIRRQVACVSAALFTHAEWPIFVVDA